MFLELFFFLGILFDLSGIIGTNVLVILKGND